MTPKSVLVVDDDADVATVIGLTLEAEGYAVTTLNDSSDAVAVVKRAPPDLVILDYMMPGRTGPDVAVALGREGFNLPLLFVTGLPADMPSIQGYPLLSKPVDLDRLLATVAGLIGPP